MAENLRTLLFPPTNAPWRITGKVIKEIILNMIHAVGLSVLTNPGLRLRPCDYQRFQENKLEMKSEIPG